MAGGAAAGLYSSCMTAGTVPNGGTVPCCPATHPHPASSILRTTQGRPYNLAWLANLSGDASEFLPPKRDVEHMAKAVQGESVHFFRGLYSSYVTAGTACLPDRQACLPDRQVPNGRAVPQAATSPSPGFAQQRLRRGKPRPSPAFAEARAGRPFKGEGDPAYGSPAGRVPDKARSRGA